jgi:hypothetical protein
MMSDERDFYHRLLVPAYERAERECKAAVEHSREVSDRLRSLHGKDVRLEEFPIYVIAAGTKDDQLKRCVRLRMQMSALAPHRGTPPDRFAEFYRWLASRYVTADYANFERDLQNFYLC